jgi:formylglycine-generating enzyme required for sulfatase activity
MITWRKANGITFVSIPGGTYRMGDIEGKESSSGLPVHSVTLAGFEMSGFEIVNAQYAQFLNEALKTGDITVSGMSVMGAKGPFIGQEYICLSGTDSSFAEARCRITYHNNTFSVVKGYENWPVLWVTWYGSKAFALYYSLDLPTEAEWEYACRGGRQYEYGTDDGTLSTDKANYWYTGMKHPVAVGSFPKNPFGLYDMCGNVWEWCHDWHGPYPESSVTNPSGPQKGSSRVIRGGSYLDSDFCRSAHHDFISPGERSFNVGFRVVRRVSPLNYCAFDI